MRHVLGRALEVVPLRVEGRRQRRDRARPAGPVSIRTWRALPRSRGPSRGPGPSVTPGQLPTLRPVPAALSLRVAREALRRRRRARRCGPRGGARRAARPARARTAPASRRSRRSRAASCAPPAAGRRWRARRPDRPRRARRSAISPSCSASPTGSRPTSCSRSTRTSPGPMAAGERGELLELVGLDDARGTQGRPPCRRGCSSGSGSRRRWSARRAC